MTFKSTWSTNICGFDNEYFLNKIWISSNLCALGRDIYTLYICLCFRQAHYFGFPTFMD